MRLITKKHLYREESDYELLKALEDCMKHPTPKPFMLHIVYDIKSWISDHAEEVHEHMVPKCFKFELNDEGKATMLYRNWSHEQWQGPIVILKNVPHGKTNLVSPSWPNWMWRH